MSGVSGLEETQSAQRVKREGIHYTPPSLADFVAARLVRLANLEARRTVKVLDPASGDGSLLLAVAQQLRLRGHEVALYGRDIDANALARAGERLARSVPWASFTGTVADFTENAIERTQDNDFAGADSSDEQDRYDLVIANPPYVRTQHLGAERSQALAQRFGLTGRVDLYQAFVVSLESVLAPDASFALIIPNRFLMTRGGHSIRKFLAERYRVDQIVDLGDTKLFSAAVLPALVFGRQGPSVNNSVSVTSIYSTSSPDRETPATSIFSALELGVNGTFAVDGQRWKVTSGKIPIGASVSYAAPWVAATEDAGFLGAVDAHTWDRFKSLGRIRVGVKTTADKVFIRRDWLREVPISPEREVIRPLLSSDTVRRWGSVQSELSILYPYDLTQLKRTPLDLEKYPATLSYLESYRADLEARTYLAEGGRQWWEIWVPQKPSAWATPKIVFPDISVEGRFAIDRTGAIVNGNCYWIAIDGLDEDLAYLALAVGNSTLATRYYDARFGNKLYASRRRFISQYVNEFPLPRPDAPAAQRAVAIARILEHEADPDRVASLEHEANAAVWSAFGVEES